MNASWKVYEEQILEKFRNEFPEADLSPNKKVKGIHSNSLRQVDILISGRIVGYDLSGVIECKYFNKKLDVKIIDSFIGFVEDVKANFGIIITNKGFTNAAVNRAVAKDIKIEIVEFKNIDSYSFRWDSCEACVFSSGYSHNIEWSSKRTAVCKRKIITVEVGTCTYCSTLHLKCSVCGHIICINENYGMENECFCGNTFIVENAYIGEGMYNDEIYIKCNRVKIKMSK